MVRLTNLAEGYIGLATFNKALVEKHHSLLYCHALHTVHCDSISRHDRKLAAHNVVGSHCNCDKLLEAR